MKKVKCPYCKKKGKLIYGDSDYEKYECPDKHIFYKQSSEDLHYRGDRNGRPESNFTGD